jgi:hypothetical protein
MLFGNYINIAYHIHRAVKSGINSRQASYTSLHELFCSCLLPESRNFTAGIKKWSRLLFFTGMNKTWCEGCCTTEKINKYWSLTPLQTSWTCLHSVHSLHFWPLLFNNLKNRTTYSGNSWTYLYLGADKSLARPTSRCILFDDENISFDASLVLYI